MTERIKNNCSITCRCEKFMRPQIMAVLALLACARLAFSQPVITSFSQSRVLVCSKLAPGSVATVESASSLGAGTSWQDLQSGIVTQDGTLQVTVPASQPSVSIFYRVRGTGWPGNMALIPAGSFEMGDGHLPLEGASDGLPVHIVYVSAFYMDRYEVTRALWDEVSNWAVTNGYSFDYDLSEARTL